MDTLIKTGNGSIEATLRRRRILFARFMTRMEEEVREVWRIGGERGLYGGAGKRVGGAFLGRPQGFRHQRRLVDGCSLGRGEIAQGGGIRGGMFLGEINRCRESQDWTTACNSMRERNDEDQE